MENLYITKYLISTDEISEIDFQLKESFGFDDEIHTDIVEIIKGKSKWGPQTYPIEIDQLIEFLQRRKLSGATHVELDYHEDHIGYEMSFYRITKSTSDEIRLFESELEDERKYIRSQKREDLHRQLRDLDDDIAVPGY
jgi:hypothetical protein